MPNDVMRVDVIQKPSATIPPRVSYSQMSLYQQCGLKFYFGYIAGWQEPPTAALVGGNITHLVAEHLYKLSPEQRTVEMALELLREHGPVYLEKPQNQAFKEDNKMKTSVREAVVNLFDLEDPMNIMVQPEHLEMNLRVPINGVEFTGTVDRFTQDGLNRVSDYKTGRGPGRFLEKRLTQPFLYALAFKTQHDIDVQEVELIYLNAKEVHRISVDVKNMDDAGQQLVTMSDGSKTDFANSSWEAKTGPLCDYCAFRQVCPAVNIGTTSAMPGSDESNSLLASAGLLQK